MSAIIKVECLLLLAFVGLPDGCFSPYSLPNGKRLFFDISEDMVLTLNTSSVRKISPLNWISNELL